MDSGIYILVLARVLPLVVSHSVSLQASAPVGPGMPSQAVLQGLSALIRPMTQQHPPAVSQDPQGAGTAYHGPNPGQLQNPADIPDNVALKMAIDASLSTASQEGMPIGNRKDSEVRRDGKSKPEAGVLAGWGDDEERSNYNGWGSSTEAGPSRILETSEFPAKRPAPVPIPEYIPHVPTQVENPAPVPAPSSRSAPPSAPPIPHEYVAPESVYDGPIHYPSIDTSPVKIDFSAVTPYEEPPAPSAPKAEEKGSQCVVCWDAPAQGVCIPCGHLAGCMECLSEIKAKNWGCPVCRAPIQQVVKVYAV